MSFVNGTAAARTGTLLRHQETVAADALADLVPSGPPLGAFVSSPGLGAVPAAAVAVAKAAPAIIDVIKRFGGGGVSIGDRAQAIWKSLPPEAIRARVGAGGWWYDIEDGHQLSHEEAENRQRTTAAAAINARVGDDGWWYDNQTGQQLTYQDAIDRYERLTVTGSPLPDRPSPLPSFTPSNALPVNRVPVRPATGASSVARAGLTPTAIVVGLGAIVAIALVTGSRKR